MSAAVLVRIDPAKAPVDLVAEGKPPTVAFARHLGPLDGGAEMHPLVKSARNPFHGIITLGRDERNDIILASPHVSRVHAYVTVEANGAHHIHDRGSTNGTFVNGTPLARGASAWLTDGTRIDLGKGGGFAFVFYSAEAIARFASLERGKTAA